MKLNYLITSLITLLFLINSCADSSNDSSSNSSATVTENQSSANQNTHQGDTIFYDQAAAEVALYQLCQKLIPDSCKWNSQTGKLEFKPLYFSGDIKDSLDAWLGTSQGGQNKFSLFPYQKDIATSYFIPKEDFRKSLGAMDSLKASCNGFRMFMAMRPTSPQNTGNKFSSHLLMTPATYSAGSGQYWDDSLVNNNGQCYLMDLTTPCPKACPTNDLFPTNFLPQ